MNYELIGFFGFRQKIKALRLCLKLDYATVTSERTLMACVLLFTSCSAEDQTQGLKMLCERCASVIRLHKLQCLSYIFGCLKPAGTA